MVLISATKEVLFSTWASKGISAPAPGEAFRCFVTKSSYITSSLGKSI